MRTIMSEQDAAAPRSLEGISDDVILSLEVTPRDYLDRIFSFSQRVLELSFRQDQATGKSFFTLSNEVAIEEAQIHVALTHDPIKLEQGSIRAGTLTGCASIWHMTQRYLILQEQKNNPTDEEGETPDDEQDQTSP
ncbi:MAG: hypothetical protein K2X45_02035 [Phreatobacter sp.]|nr:hypothetical protein [Phreatobacter sp.]